METEAQLRERHAEEIRQLRERRRADELKENAAVAAWLRKAAPGEFAALVERRDVALAEKRRAGRERTAAHRERRATAEQTQLEANSPQSDGSPHRVAMGAPYGDA